MTDPAMTPAYRPIGEEPSGAGALFRHLIPLGLLACLAASFLAPDALRRALPGRLGDPVAVRMLSIFGLFLFVAVAGVRDGRRRLAARRAALASFAASVGGRVTERPLRLDASGWEEGAHVEYDAQGLSAVLSVYRGKQSTFSFRLACDAALRRDFQMQILPGGAAMRFVLSKTFLLPVLSVAVKTGGGAGMEMRRAGSSGAGSAGAAPGMTPALLVERMRFLADDPVTTGDPEFDRAYLVKASDRDAGRTAAADPGLHAALAALAGRTKSFQVGLESEMPGAPARLCVSATAESSPELFLAMDGALRAMASALARAGVLDGGARGVA
jgi:hypothetical protein